MASSTTTRTGLVHHDANPVLAWMVGNAVAELDAAGNIKPSKARSPERIDGIAAWCDALVVWMAADRPAPKSLVQFIPF